MNQMAYMSISLFFFGAINITFLFTENGEVYTWGWKECIPSGRVFGDQSMGTSLEKDVFERQNFFLTDQGNYHMG